MKLYQRVARQLFAFEHPRSSWQAHPNFKQQEQQSGYEQQAKVLIRRMAYWSGTALDPDAPVVREMPS